MNGSLASWIAIMLLIAVVTICAGLVIVRLWKALSGSQQDAARRSDMVAPHPSHRGKGVNTPVIFRSSESFDI